MSRDWDVTFSFWGAPPSNTEQEKCDNAERAIRKAIAASTTFSSKDIKVFVQGSYANSTNVRQDSDVDICVLYTEAWFSDYEFTPQPLSASLMDNIFIPRSKMTSKPHLFPTLARRIFAEATRPST